METAPHSLVPNQGCAEVRCTPANLQQPGTVSLNAPKLFHPFKFRLHTDVGGCASWRNMLDILLDN